jgi:3-oxoacyl-[acyl-carrier protein] reductase
MDIGLSGRVYIVTGGTKGLGFATARELVSDGAKVVVSSRSRENVDAAVTALGDGAVGVVVDNTDAQAPRQLIDAARESFGRLDGMLVSVGGPPAGAVLDTDEQAWEQAFSAVFLGAVRLVRQVGEELAEGGAVALVLSSSVRSPIPNLGISNGLRPGLAMVGKTVADELGPRGVRVVSLLPGSINTERMQELDAGDPNARARREAGVPLRRIGEPEEFGRVAAFLLSPAASYVTGSVVAVDGGMIRTL